MWALLLACAAISGAAATLCTDSVTLCTDGVQFCCCVGGPPVCTCCATATDACAAGVCVPASASPTPSQTATPTLSAGASSSQTPSATLTITRTPLATPSPTPTPSRSRSASPSQTPSVSAPPTPSLTNGATPSPSACVSGNLAVLACNSTTIVLAGGSVLQTPLVVTPTTQVAVAGSLTVAAPITFAAGAAPIVVLNGSLVLQSDLSVSAQPNETRIVLFRVDGNISFDDGIAGDSGVACLDAVPDTSVRGEFAVLVVPNDARGCAGKKASSSPTALWALTAIGGVACVCACVCVVVAVAAALFAYRFHSLRWLFHERERPSDSVIHSGIVRASGRERA